MNDLNQISTGSEYIYRDFSQWTSLNDTIMGGSSQLSLIYNNIGLEMNGNIIEESGGFVSCCSPRFEKNVDLSKYKGILIKVEGEGRTLKFAISSHSDQKGISSFFYRGIRWVAEVPTRTKGITELKIFFKSFKPCRRAKNVFVPWPLDTSAISQFQLLHSKFGMPGKLNEGFRSGQIRILLHSITAFY